MRILRIRGKNLASLAGDFDVDFESGPLAGDGLFTISGPTGAGKSTLLDAVCLALFNETPRNSAETGSVKIPDGDVEITSSDPRTVLRRGTAEGFAEVTFKGQDGRRYVARWSAARAGGRVTGRLQTQKLSLHDVESNQPLGRTQTEILAETRQRVGLSFPQFRRSALLAQGDFAAFLKANSSDRADLLERMTGTEIYGELSMRAHLRARLEADRQKELEQAAKGESPLDSEARQLLEYGLAEARKLAADANKKVDALKGNVLWWKRLAELEESIDEAREEQSQKAAALAAAAPVREALAQVLDVQPLRSLHDDLRRATKESERARHEAARASEALTAAEAEHLRATEAKKSAEQTKEAVLEGARLIAPEIDRAKQADSMLEGTTKALEQAQTDARTVAEALAAAIKESTEIAAEIQEARTRHGDANTWLAAHPLAVALVPDWIRIEPELASYLTEQSESRRLEECLTDAAKAVAAADLQRKACEEATAATNAAVETAKAALVETQADEAKMPAEALSDRREELGQARENLAALERVLAATTALDQQLRAKRAETSQANEEAVRLDEKAVAAREALKPIIASIQTTEELQRKAAAILSLEGHRQALRDGDACPLCGSKSHPGIDRASATEAVFSQKLRELSDDRENLTKEETAAQEQAKARRNRACEVEVEAKQIVERLAQEEQKWKQARQAIADESVSVLALDVDAASVVSRLKETNSENLRQLALDEEEARKRKNAVGQARRALDDANDQASNAREASDQSARLDAQATKRLLELKGQAHAIEVSLDSRTRVLDHAFRTHPTWKADMATDSSAFARKCGQYVSMAITQQTQKTAAETALRKLEPLEAKISERVDSAQKQRDAATWEQLKRSTESDEAKAARAGLLGGRPVKNVEAENEANGRAADLILESARRVSSESGEKLAAARTRNAAANSENVQRSELHRALTERLTESSAAKNIELAELQRRLEFDTTWIETKQRHLKTLEDETKVAQTRLEERERSLQAHTKTGRPEGTRDETVVELDPAQRLLDEHQKTVNNSELLLKQDDEKRGRNQEALKRVEKQKSTTQLWASMRELIGSADGKLFRSFAQSLTLESLVEHANLHLQDLAPRYELQRVPKQDVDLQIIDRDMGGEIRSVTSLSGGETFLVSLALALGLSSLASDRVRIDSLFIDEGFGSLDQETLELALSTLDSLQADGRKVGLISHVQGLSERIGVQVRIEPMGAGRSQLRVIAA